MQSNLAQSLLVFFSLFSFASAALLSIYHDKEQREYVFCWIIASILIGVGAIFGAFTPAMPDIPSYKISVTCAFIGSLFFNYSISTLLGKKVNIRQLSAHVIGSALLFLLCLYVTSEYAGAQYQPAVVATFLAATSFVGFLLSLKYYRENFFTLASALSITFLITALVWAVRIIAVVNYQVGFAYEGGTINAVIFISLLILSILRFLVFGGLVMEIIERKRGLISEEFNQLKLQVANQKISKSEERLQYVLNITGDGIWDWDISTGEVKHNDRWMSILGEKPRAEIFTNNDFKTHIHPDDLVMVLNHLESALLNDVPYHLQYRMIRSDKAVVWVQDRGQVVERSSTGEPLRMIGAISDISSRKRDQDQIKELAFFDQLTKLPNRNYIKDRIYRAIQESIRDKKYSGLIYLDLDNFKNVNDRYGHHVGDILLMEFGRRIQHAVRPKDIVARIGGDEFLVLLEQVDSIKSDATDKLQQIIDRIENSLLESFDLGSGINIDIKVSSGIVIFGEEVAKFDDILKFADLAMYSAKRDHSISHRFFDDHMQAEFDQSIRLLDDLNTASDLDQFYAEYQPIVNREKKVIAYEALARWDHPVRGTVMPDDFIPIAKETGLIDKIGYSIFKNIFTNRELWGESKKQYDFTVMMNVSAHQLISPGFADRVVAMCEEYKIPKQRVNIELTEGVFLSNVELAREVMLHLQRAGIHFALDDFGTGYASLKYLADLPFQYLKIDKKFVSGLGSAEASAFIVDAILELAKGLNMKVIAEGVETKEQFEILYAKGCGYFQGYYFARPSKTLQLL